MRSNLFIILFLFLFVFSAFSENKSGISDDDEYIAKCGGFMTKEKKEKLFKILNLRDSVRPVCQKKFDEPNGRFCVHYDTTGINAVNLTDNDRNGLPDYIDSVVYYFEYAYRIEIDSMQYTSPAFDSGLGGSNAYDIYVLDIGNGDFANVAYGFTTPEDKINIPGKFSRYTSFIMIDNDFSPLDSMELPTGKKKQTYYETGISAMKITAAHEFHHAVQLVYGEDQTTFSLNEFSSTYMEYRLFPNTVDYIQFVKSLFANLTRYTFGDGNYENGYRYAIFGQYMHKQYGDEALRRMWELIGKGNTGFAALDMVFQEHQSSLPKEWQHFVPWLYYTGHRSIEGQYFKQAKIFPQLKFFIDTVFSSPSFSTSEALKSFEIRAFRCRLAPEDPAKTNDTLDIIIASDDLKGAVAQSGNDRTMPYTILCTESFLDGSKQIGTNKFYYSFFADSGHVVDSLFINRGYITNLINFCYPNPFRRDFYSEMMFPAPVNAGLGESVVLRVFNSAMQAVYESKMMIDVDNGNKIVPMKIIPDVITEGIYIFSVEWKNDILYGKFTVIK